MPKPGDLLVVHMVERVPGGTTFVRSRVEWPLHITLVPWFSADLEQASQTLDRVSATMPAANLNVGPEAQFGPDGDVRVNKIADESQHQAKQLHKVLLDALTASGARLETEQWVGDNFIAHITHHRERRRQEGDVEQLDSVTLVRLNPGNICEVIAHYSLKGHHDETAA